MIEEAIDKMTELLIEQDLKDKTTGDVEYIKISKVNLIRICIKLVKLLS